MATAVPLDALTEQLISEVLATGQYRSREAVLMQGVRFVRQAVEYPGGAVIEPLSVAERAGIERGLADVAAGRLYDHDEVFDELERRCLSGE